jgi:RNA polymerase sigma-70 factor (family 1)
MKGTSDTDLLKRISEDDRHAFREFYQRYTPELYLFVNSLCNDEALSEDIVQEIFIKLWDKRANAINIQQAKSYLFRVAKNRFLNELRKQKSKQKIINNKIYNEVDNETPEQQLTLKENIRLGEEALRKLSPRKKLIVEMRTREELSLDEISARVGISKNVVKKLLYQGLAMLRKYTLPTIIYLTATNYF